MVSTRLQTNYAVFDSGISSVGVRRIFGKLYVCKGIKYQQICRCWGSGFKFLAHGYYMLQLS